MRKMELIVIFALSLVFLVGVHSSFARKQREIPEELKKKWAQTKEMLQKELEVCKEHCGTDRDCLDKCRRTYEWRTESEYKKLLYESGQSTLEDVLEHPSCPYCGMDRGKFAHSRILLNYDDGSTVGTCSLHCAAIDMAVNIDKAPSTIQAGDYRTRKLVNAEKAFWVIGGDKPGVMTKRAKWAFSSRETADLYMQEYGGSHAGFEEAMKAAYEDMYMDTKMIREKRKKMRMRKMKSREKVSLLEDQYGIKPVVLRLTGANLFLDFRFFVLDPEKAAGLMSLEKKAYLLHQSTGTVLPVPESKLGPIRSKDREPDPERQYVMLFSNTSRIVQKGDKVTLVVGDDKTEELVVE